MKTFNLSAMALFFLFAGCNPATNISDGTIEPSQEIVTQTSITTPSLENTEIMADDFLEKIFVGENENYSIYIIEITSGNENAKTGTIVVNDKKTDQVIAIDGSCKVLLDGTIVYDDGKGEYILLSIGTYTSRNAIVISLLNKSQAVNDFCISSGQYGNHLFWRNFIIINNCDLNSNRPWGAGEAPSVETINLLTGEARVIAKSDNAHQFQVKQIDGNILQYIQTYVDDEKDWINIDKHKTEEMTYDLASLEDKR
jgi:hypothetical protein